MKRIILLLALVALPLLLAAQTQQGFVKTRGRMVNGQHVRGQGLQGAMVVVQGGNKVVTQSSNGAFSIAVPSKTFLVQSVQKKGYQLVDADAAPRQYRLSSLPIYLVMETPDEHLQDRLAAERKIRRTLQRRLEEQEDKIEAMDISLHQKQQLLDRLYQQQEGDERLIAEMARRYAEMDFDQLDEKNRRISEAILEGRLTEADSLLKTKGDLHTRVAEVKQAQAAEEREEKELARRRKTLNESRAGTQAKLNDVAEDCRSRYELFKMTHQIDSAAAYLQLRAELDTTNAVWQRDVAEFNFNYLSRTDLPILYATRALHLAEQQKAAELQAELNMLLGDIYDSQRILGKANFHYQQGASTMYKVYGANHPYVAEYFFRCLPKVAPYRSGFLLQAYEYQRSKNICDSMKIDGQHVNPYSCIDIWERSLQHPVAGIDSCWILRRLGDSYFYFKKDIDKAVYYYSRAMNAYEQHDGRLSLEVGRMYYCMGDCYYSMSRKFINKKDQNAFVQQEEKRYAKLALQNLAESADVLCGVVTPNHRDVRLTILRLMNVVSGLRRTPCNVDSIFVNAHPILANYQAELLQRQAWDEYQPLDTATTEKGLKEQGLVNGWNERSIQARQRSAWIVTWKKAHPDDNRFPMPLSTEEIKAEMRRYGLE